MALSGTSGGMASGEVGGMVVVCGIWGGDRDAPEMMVGARPRMRGVQRVVGGSGQWGVMGEGHISAVCVRHGTGVASVRGGQSVLSMSVVHK